MPDAGNRFGFIILAVVASTLTLANKFPGLGVDLSGGTILVYEMDKEKLAEFSEQGGGSRITSEDLIEPLSRRLNPSGTKEIVIRPYGETQIEIIVPAVEQTEVERIKKQMQQAGKLQFAIVANQLKHQAEIELATDQAQSKSRKVRMKKSITEDDEIVGLWGGVARELVNGDPGPYRVDVSRDILRNPLTGELLRVPPEAMGDALASWVEKQGLPGVEVLLIINPYLNVTGEDLAFASSTFDNNGSPAVSFTLTSSGASRFFALTTDNAPSGTQYQQLGIVLDDVLLSAPRLNEAIRSQGQITGNFTREEVDDLVKILKAGQLPAALNKTPIAENQISATLGQDTINKGFYAIGTSLILVLVFILFYYRFAGILACIALILNLALILMTMVFISQPLTLPGLAGLVLTVGMSVDANVLIFERIREELKKGSAPRMAIRNGFAKATVTIVDANLTTLITAIVLYAIGTDQIRGFAVTLILGILFSMFSAIYVSRTLFDLAEKKGFLSLAMSDGVNRFREKIAGEAGLNFVGKGRMMLAVSAILLVIGIASLFTRGKSILDIDFAGGSSLQFRLAAPAEPEAVRAAIKSEMVKGDEELPYTLNGVSMEDAENKTVYKVDSSFEDVNDLKAAVKKALANNPSIKLITYEVTISPAGDPQSRSTPRHGNGVMLVVAQDDSASATKTELSSSFSDAEVTSSALIQLGVDGGKTGGKMNAETLKDTLIDAAKAVEVTLIPALIDLEPVSDDASTWTETSSLKFDTWKVTIPIPASEADMVMESFQTTQDTTPVWVSSSAVGAQVAGDMIQRAFGALFASIACIILYIWFRFQRVIYGFAAVAALIHDVLITLGAIAVSYWLANFLGILLIDPFKISLTVVAALLTIVGYSLNDTIVVFDRIRETKGKAPKLTGEMVNQSINQTLSRTLLTSITTLIVVLLLYLFGGDGIHAFAFALVIGVMVGTYSSIFVASPILLWLVGRDDRNTKAA